MKNKHIVVFYIVTVFFWASNYVYVPIQADYAASLGADAVMLGLITGAYGFAQMCLRTPTGILSDRLRRRKPFVLLGTVLGTLSALGMFLLKTPTALMLMRGVAGFSASMWVVYSVLYASYFDPRTVTAAMGRVNAAASVGQTLAMLLGGWLAQQWGGGAAFLAAAAAGLAGCLCAGFVREAGGDEGIGARGQYPLDPQTDAAHPGTGKVIEYPNPPAQAGAAEGFQRDNVPLAGGSGGTASPQRSPSPPLSVRDLLRVGLTPSLLIVAGFAILHQLIQFSTSFGFTPVWGKQIGMNAAELGVLTTLAALGAVVSSYLGPRLIASRIGERRQAAIGFAVAALATLAIPLTRSAAALYVAQAVSGLGGGLTFPILMALSIKSVPEEKRGAAMGFFQAIYSVGMFIGPVFTGILSQAFSLQLSFICIGAVGILSCAMMLLSAARDKRRRGAV